MRNATKYGNMTQDHVMHLLLVSERGQAGLASQPTPTGPRLHARTGTRLTGADTRKELAGFGRKGERGPQRSAESSLHCPHPCV